MPQLEDANGAPGIRDIAVHTPATPEVRRRELANLPVDVLHCILDFLPSPYWLRPVLLASKQFYDLVAPHLYRRIVWSVGSSTHYNLLNKQLLDMLDRNNRALDHVRRIELINCDEFSKEPDTDYEYPDVELFVHFLPNDILQSFQWNSWHPLPSKIYRTLLSRQRSLTELELNYTEIALDELYGCGSTSPLNDVKCLKRLRIMPGPGEALSQAACDLFKQHHEISELTLDLYHLRGDDEPGWGDSSATNGGLLGKLFRGLDPSDNCIRILDLNSVDLRGSHDTIGSAINPKHLKVLTIAKCLHTEEFLMAANEKLGKRGPLHLSRFLLYHAREWDLANHAADADDDIASTSLVKELSTFLTSTTKSLRGLWVCLRGYDALPTLSSIISNGSTLEWLFLDIRILKGAPAVIYSLPQWQELCSSLKVVRQVDTAYPSVVADCRLGDYQEFCEFVTATANIPTLTALGVNDWPYLAGTNLNDRRASSFRTERNNQVYCHILTALASDILDLRERPAPKPSTFTPTPKNSIESWTTLTNKKDLAVITFGMHEKITQDRNPGYGLTRPVIFVKSQSQLWTGECLRTMEPVGLWAVTMLGCYEWSSFSIDEVGRDVGKYEHSAEVGW